MPSKVELSKGFDKCKYLIKDISKEKVCIEHIELSIRLTLNDNYPISIHTLIVSSYKILRDLKKKDSELDLLFDIDKFIPDEEKREFWSQRYFAYNNFKHSDKEDKSSKINLNPLLNDLLIFEALILYNAVFGYLSRDMKIFMQWFALVYPKFAIIDFSTYSEDISELLLKISDVSRSEQLIIGKTMLENKDFIVNLNFIRKEY